MDNKIIQPTCIPIEGGIIISLDGPPFFIPNSMLQDFSTLSATMSTSTSSTPSQQSMSASAISATDASFITGQTPQDGSTVDGLLHLNQSLTFDDLSNSLLPERLDFNNPTIFQGSSIVQTTNVYQADYPISHDFNAYTFFPSQPPAPIDAPLPFWDTPQYTPSEPQLPENFFDFSAVDDLHVPSEVSTMNFDSSTSSPSTVSPAPYPKLHRQRSDKGKSKQGNNSKGRTGKLRCSPCRKNHKRCTFKEGSEVCDRCVELGIEDACDKKYGPVRERKMAMPRT